MRRLFSNIKIWNLQKDSTIDLSIKFRTLNTSNSLTPRSETGSSEPATSEVYSESRSELGAPPVDVLQIGFGVDTSVSLVVSHRRSSIVHVVQTRRRSTAHAAECALQSVLERLPKLAVEVGVNDGIQSRVEISDPEYDGDNFFRAVQSAWIAQVHC